jgi:hypothetical protein
MTNLKAPGLLLTGLFDQFLTSADRRSLPMGSMVGIPDNKINMMTAGFGCSHICDDDQQNVWSLFGRYGFGKGVADLEKLRTKFRCTLLLLFLLLFFKR